MDRNPWLSQANDKHINFGLCCLVQVFLTYGCTKLLAYIQLHKKLSTIHFSSPFLALYQQNLIHSYWLHYYTKLTRRIIHFRQWTKSLLRSHSSSYVQYVHGKHANINGYKLTVLFLWLLKHKHFTQAIQCVYLCKTYWPHSRNHLPDTFVRSTLLARTLHHNRTWSHWGMLSQTQTMNRSLVFLVHRNPWLLQKWYYSKLML